MTPRERVSAMLRRARAGDPGLHEFRDLELGRELGRGAQGVVFLARRRGEPVALKFVTAEADPGAWFTFRRELETIRTLRHPGIVAFLGSAECCLLYEYCAGGSLHQRGILSLDEAVRHTLDVLAALAYAHAAPVHAPLADGSLAQAIGLVHRDVTPHNILLTGAGAARLADFGLAKAFEHAGLSGHTRTGSVGGSIPFMARAQLVNYKYAGPEVDVWAAAACLYWLLTGTTPRDFPPGKDPIAVGLRDPVVPIRERRPVPARVADVLDATLIENAITTADGLAAALRQSASAT